MPITLITGPANAGKARVVIDAVHRHLAHGQEPLLIVPTRMDVEHYRRELAQAGGVMGVRVGRFRELIEEAATRAGVGGPLLGGLARERAICALAEQCAPAHAGVGRGFGRALGELIAELKDRRVSPARLRRALAAWQGVAAQGARAPAEEVSLELLAEAFESYERLLKDTRRLDPEARAGRALDGLRREPARWRGTPVLLYGFDDLTPLQLDAIETLGAIVDAPLSVSLSYEPGRIAFASRAGSFHSLAALAAEHHQLGARADYYAPAARSALGHLERSLFERGAQRCDPGEAVRLLEGANEREELELVAEQILRLLADGMAPQQIAVVMRSVPAAADLLAEVFSAAAVPFAVARTRRLADTAIGRALIGALRCAQTGERGAAGEKRGAAVGGETGDLLAWLRAPGVLDRPELADRLERQARRAGALSVAQARALWEEQHWPLERIDRLRTAAERGAGALYACAASELERLFCAPRRGSASLLSDDEREDAAALVAGRRALEELTALARVAPALAPGDPAGLAHELEAVTVAGGEPAADGVVAVLDPLALRARRVRALFLCRLQEGVFPAPERPLPVLGAEERRALAQASGLRLHEPVDATSAERFLLYAAVSRPQELLVLSWHGADEQGTPCMRSLFVDDVCDAFDERLVPTRREPPSALDAGAARRARTHADGTGRRPGLRDPRVLEELFELTWSPSSISAWISCPVRWLVEKLLRAEDLEPDAEALARGGLAHAALRDTLAGLARERGSARLTPASVERARELLRAALEGHASEFPLSPAPERVPGIRRRLEADLERFLEHAAAANAGAPAQAQALEPTHLELSFGFARAQPDAAEEADGRGGEGELGPVELAPGVRLRGRIDRVDVGAGGAAVVYDYKGRGATPAAKWLAEGDVQVALYMRAIEQLLGVRAVGGFYQPLAGSDLRARGVLERDSGVAIECVGSDQRDHDEVQVLLDEVTAAAREAVAQARRGELVAQPQSCAFRGGCSYPTICRCEP